MKGIFSSDHTKLWATPSIQGANSGVRGEELQF